VPAGTAGKKRSIADVAVSYANMMSKQKGQKRGVAQVEFSAAKTLVASRQNKQVIEAAVEAIATDENRRALVLRDQGKVKEAQQALQQNAAYLQREGERLDSVKLRTYGAKNVENARGLDSADWSRTRKTMRENQTTNSLQRGW
jgi:hypothetical protein